MGNPLAIAISIIGRDQASPAMKTFAASTDAASVSAERFEKTNIDKTFASAQASASKAEKSVGSFGSKMGATVASSLKMVGGLALLAGGFEAVKGAIDVVKEASAFQKSMLLVQTQAGASAAEVASFSNQILALAGPTATAPDALANSLYHVVSASKGLISAANEMKIVQIAAEGAKVGGANLEETTNALTAAVASGIPGVKNYSQAMGALNTIVGAGDMKLSDLNDALSNGVLVTAKQFGLDLTDVGAALDVFGDNNIRGAQAATSLRMAIQGMSDPVKTGAATFKMLNLSQTQLATDMQQGGLNKALVDLSTHLTSADITGDKLGSTLTDAFGKRAGTGIAILVDQLDRFQLKEKEIDDGSDSFSADWVATTKTVSFQFDQLSAEAQAAGISFATKALPAASDLAKVLIGSLTVGIKTAGVALHPFVTAWDDVAPVLTDAEHALKNVASFLAPVAPVLENVGGAALTMWAAFKGYQIAAAAVSAIKGEIVGLSLAAKANLGSAGSSVRTWGAAWSGVGTESNLVAVQMEADMAAIGRQAAIEAAAIDEANAQIAESEADLVAASHAATLLMITDSEELAAAARTQADASASAAVTTAESAAAAATAVDVAGDAAKVGWAGLAGPIGIAAIGVLTLVSMFHKSSTASKEATDAAKAYTDALNTGGKSALVDSITTQLANNNVPAKIAALNSALGHTEVTGKQFVTAIDGGSSAVATMRDHLQSIITANTLLTKNNYGNTIGKVMNPAAMKAASLLKDLNVQVTALTDTAKKDLSNTQAFAGVSGAIQKTTVSTQLGTDAAKQYATMAGLVVDKNGIVAASQKAVDAAVGSVSKAYDTATQSGDAYLSALDAFSKSAGTANDRATIIGATLKANAGDALGFASAINGASTSVSQLGTDIASAAAAVGKNGEKTSSLLSNIVDLKTGTIDYSKSAAAPLISDLQSVQTAAINAATATYQHNLRLEGGKKAADDAVAGYKGVESSLESQLVQMGLTSTQAQKLTDKYLGVPSKVKTLIEQEGADPVVNVLNKIGTQLAYLTGHPWNTKINAQTSAAAANIAFIKSQLADLPSYKTVTITAVTKGNLQGTYNSQVPAHAAGGSVADGLFTVGEQGYELGRKVGSHVEIYSHAQSVAMTGMDKVPGYASGTGSITHSGKNWIYQGISYASERAAHNAEVRRMASLAKSQAAAQKTLLHTVSGDARGVAGYAAAGNLSSLTTKLTNLRTALSDAGVRSSWIGRIAGDSTRLEHATSALSKASAALAAAKAVKATDVANTKAGITGSFDITSAGQDASTGAVTGGSILAASTQAVARAKAFYSGLSKLTNEKVLPADYIRAIAAKGPDDLAEVSALLSLPKSQLNQLRVNDTALNNYGSALGNTVGGVLDNGAISKAQSTVSKDERAINVDTKALAKDLASALVSVGWKTTVTVKGPDLVIALKAATKQSSSTRGAVR